MKVELMTNKIAVSTKMAPKAIGPYSQGIAVDSFLFVSGQLPVDQNGDVVEGGIREQTKKVLENIKIFKNNDFKNALSIRHLDYNINGAVLIGDLSVEWYHHENDFDGSPSEFPCDLLLMDLDGTWSDSDSDGMYDSHVDGIGDTAPEIYVGRIDASNIPGDEITILKDYFQKLDEYWKEEAQKYKLIINEVLNLIESCEDSRVLGWIYSIVGAFYGHFGVRFGEDEKEESGLIDECIRFYEKALIHAREINDKSMIILILYWLDYFTITKRKYKYVQKRIVNDINEIIELGKIYSRVPHICYWADMLPAVYYAVIARMKVFTPAQRKIYTDKCIEYTNKSFNNLTFIPFSSNSHSVLTSAYSNLATFTTDKDDQKKYVEEMFQHAKEAEKFAEIYEGGMARSSGYNRGIPQRFEQ